MKKPPIQAAQETEPDIKLLDEAMDCCQHIQAVAGLLQRTALYPNAEPVDSLLVANSGYLIGREIESLLQTLGQLHESLRQPDGKPRRKG